MFTARESARFGSAGSTSTRACATKGACSIVDEPTAVLSIAFGAQFIVGPSFNERVVGSATGARDSRFASARDQLFPRPTGIERAGGFRGHPRR
jgi:hypothetical protein